MCDRSDIFRQQIADAYHDKTALEIVAGGSKRWYGRVPAGEPLNVSDHSGIISYQPTELVITARAGTPLSEIADALDEQRQRLPFDPPYYGDEATLGGTVACGFSGPRRPYAGACRDFMLGCRVINGRGELMRFGGQVMKNVAGFDVSRLMAGSLGTLGLLTEISMKVLPHRQTEQTVVIEADFCEAITIMNRWGSSALPITAMAADGHYLYFRICGTSSAVNRSVAAIGGEIYADGLQLWKDIREHQLPFFTDQRPLWRLSLPADTMHLELPDSSDRDWFIGWGGAQRWLFSELPSEIVFAAAREAGGHATQFRGGNRNSVFAPLTTAEMQLHQRLKAAFDPAGILNPGRIYAEL